MIFIEGFNVEPTVIELVRELRSLQNDRVNYARSISTERVAGISSPDASGKMRIYTGFFNALTTTEVVLPPSLVATESDKSLIIDISEIFFNWLHKSFDTWRITFAPKKLIGLRIDPNIIQLVYESFDGKTYCSLIDFATLESLWNDYSK